MRNNKNMADYVKISGGSIEAGVSIFRFEDGGSKIAYAPSLDVIGYGRTYDEANSDLDFCMGEFFRSTMGNGSFEAEMARLGWRKEERRMVSPQLSEIVSQREVLRDVLDSRIFKKIHKTSSFSFSHRLNKTTQLTENQSEIAAAQAAITEG